MLSTGPLVQSSFIEDGGFAALLEVRPHPFLPIPHVPVACPDDGSVCVHRTQNSGAPRPSKNASLHAWCFLLLLMWYA